MVRSKIFTLVFFAIITLIAIIVLCRLHTGTISASDTIVIAAKENSDSITVLEMAEIVPVSDIDTIAVPAAAVPAPIKTATDISTATIYYSTLKEGLVGNYDGRQIDNPADNLFVITVDRLLTSSDKVWLQYELTGIAGAAGVARSINDRHATGGYLVHLSDSISLQREQLNPSWLVKGENRILFTIPENAAYGYKVSNPTLVIEKDYSPVEPVVITTTNESYGYKVYIRGYVADSKKTTVSIAGIEIPLNDGEFETVTEISDENIITVVASNVSDSTIEKNLYFDRNFSLDKEFAWNNYEIKKIAKTVQKGTVDSLAIGSAILNISEGALLTTSKLSITGLRTVDMPALDMGMINVTNEDQGYRFLPHGENFTQGATVALKYDRTKIPSGYTENDIYTYYFDNETRHWVALERDTIDRQLCMVVSQTTHFTDMINGIIQTPESPETQGFAPTMMTDIKAADPTAKIELIAPPTANNRGAAGLSYTFEVPPARNGMQPQLGLQYNSDGGSGWYGEGWDINIPSISVDTRWGVPRYNDALETETYTMDGEMLVTMDENGQPSVAHRGEKIVRTTDRQFYPRNEGTFSRIIRKGSDPSNYTWEVTDKNGTIYYYGGEGATLNGTITTIGGLQKNVIARWMLKKIVELHGDYIEYNYDTVNETVIGDLTANAIYLSSVSAGNKGAKPHTVVTFTNNAEEKQKKTNNARYGFLTSSNKLLDKVTVSFEGKELRSYGFTYKQGAFFVDLLDRLTHYDNEGDEVASHYFEYYDDIQFEAGYVPFSNNSETWNTGNDNINGGFILPGVSDQASALSGSISKNTGVNGYAGIGLWDGAAGFKSSTVGASYSYSSSNTSGKVMMIDINGDGLPDKVFEAGGKLYYRPNQSKPESTNIQFGAATSIIGINKLSYTKSRTNSYGGKVNTGWGPVTVSVGKDKSTTNTDQTIYFTDVNNDGLPDLVMNSRVYFNHIQYDTQGNAIPNFTLSSADTPSPIMGGGTIDISDFDPDPAEQDTLLMMSPLLDVVRVWEAPFDGMVNVSGTVQLQLPTGNYDTEEYDKADGVRVAIQSGVGELWNKQIAKGDVTVYNASVDNISVTKGQRIYFRLQSGNQEMSNGAFDEVIWNPTITYTGKPDRINPDGQSTITFPTNEGELLNDLTGLILLEASPVTVNGNFIKPITSDSLTLWVMLSNDMENNDGTANLNYKTDTVYTRTFAWDETHNGNLSFTIPNTIQGSHLVFQVSANTNVAWNEVIWQPVATYTASGHIQIAPASVEYTLYSLQVKEGEDYQVSTNTTLSIKPAVTWNNLPHPATGEMIVSVKNTTGLIAKKEYSFVDGVIITPDSIIDNLTVSQGALWVEYYSNDSLLLARIDSAQAQITLKNEAITQLILVNVFTQRPPDGFGPMYRGWGQFVYNSAEGRYANPIDESLLKLPKDTASANTDILTMPFIPFSIDKDTKTFWSGIDPAVYIKRDTMSASRLGEKDVVLTNPLANLPSITIDGVCRTGSGAVGVTISSVNKGNATSGSASVLSGSISDGKESSKSGFMDLNGDGYPDIITSNQVQYTNTRGGFDGEILGGTFTQGSTSDSKSYGLGGNTPEYSFSTTSGSSNTQSKGMLSAGLALSLSKGDNEDRTEYTMMDVNGDGLPDRILNGTKQVQINFGYSFSAPVNWGIGNIQSGESNSINGGLGINLGSGSIMAGIGLATTESNVLHSMMDVNGDGLPDKIDVKNRKVSLNTGNGFSSPIEWQGLSAVDQSTTVGESANAAYTTSFPIPIPFCCILKIAVNAGGNTGQSMSRSTLQFRDADGDGYPDIVSSNDDASMTVRRSTIARTNKLKDVYNPLGGNFTLDYKQTPATYNHPGGKWALASVDINHGITDQGANMRIEFDYDNGKHDRHEREFLGFGKVITKNIDTENSNVLYRNTTETFDVSNYYTKGNLLSTVLTDAQGNKYTETENIYYSYRLAATADDYTFVASNDSCSDRAIAFTPLQYTRTLMYEGQPTGLAVEASFYEYYLNGNHGEIKSFRYSDKGTLAADGSGNYNYQTNITYTGNPTKHIFGLPVTIQVTGGDGKLYRKVTADYDTNYANHLTKVSRQLNDNGTTAATDIEYDDAGNIIKKVLPKNAPGQRVEYEYKYDSKYNMYVTEVDENKKEITENKPNIYHYSSRVLEHDYRYGIPLIVEDMNGFKSITTIDNLGRTTYIRGPNEIAEGTPYTIKFEYPRVFNSPGENIKPWYAITTHYDSQHTQRGIQTVTFVDGIGRPVQVKKSGVVTTTQNGTDPVEKEVMIVSGRVKYDPFGRVRDAFQPVTENLTNIFTFNTAFDPVTPTNTSYDVLDRTLVTILPDGSETKMEYSLDAATNTMVSTVADAMGGKQTTFTNASELNLKTEQYSGPDGTITTIFDYDAVNQLLTVTDNGGNVTRSIYDMGGRRIQVEHPVSGITTFTYDEADNMLTKQTPNLTKPITYGYNYNRLTSITYLDYPENNVTYTYGASNAAQGRKGRIMLQEDASGAQEFFYGRQGELTKVRRTVVIPNQAVATYETEWRYDSWNRLTEMTYPDKEKVNYFYNTAGLLSSVQGKKTTDIYHYVAQIGYDKFEQRVYMKYGNGAETSYTYDDQRRRLSNLKVKSPASKAEIMNNIYTYDKVDNVLNVNNDIIPQTGILGGGMKHTYEYDGLYRLTSAKGTYTGTDSKTANYTLNMAYDNLHNITYKKQEIQQKDVQFTGILKVGYELTYNYDNNPFQISTLNDNNYRTDSTTIPIKNSRKHSYDANGNLISVATAVENKDGTTTDSINTRELLWDEENRLLAIADNGYISNYFYDASGERVIKKSSYGEGIYVNGVFSGGTTSNDKFTAYISPYMVVSQGGNYTKHIYIGSQRIVSKLGDLASYGTDPRDRGVTRAGSEVENKEVNYKEKYENLLNRILLTYDTLKVPYLGEYNDYDYIDGGGGSTAFSANTKSTQTNDTEKLQYFYHSDHLGSSSLITDIDGNTVQHLEYVPFGEVFIDERKGTWNTPYLFNAKELDEETGLYYYGARYYDPKTSVWLSADPLQEKYPNISTYAYCFNNPIMFIDPDGKSGKVVINAEKQTVTVASKLYFYGSKATSELSGKIATGIASQWNGANAKTTIDGVEYNVQFRIFYETVTEDKARELASGNTDLKNNFIRVEEGTEGKSSFSFGNNIGGNSFWFNTRDELGSSTTAAHEYGHGFGLDHPTEDLSGATGRPDIMTPRNTPYGKNWSITNERGNRVINPNSRRVTPQNVRDAIGTSGTDGGRVNNVIFNADGTR